MKRIFSYIKTHKAMKWSLISVAILLFLGLVLFVTNILIDKNYQNTWYPDDWLTHLKTV